MKIKILDCTLRDGGYYNNWDFTDEFIQNYLSAISQYVSIVELGLRILNSNGYKGPLAFTKDKWLSKFNLPSSIEYAVMLNASDFKHSHDLNLDVDYLFPNSCDNSPISLVRIAARYSDFYVLPTLINLLKSKGYKVAINLMQISEYSDEEIKCICKEINKLSPSIFYVADSLGCLRSDNVASLFDLISNRVDMPIGIHAHDNMGLARQNSIQASELGANYLDSTLLGMGRGAGNARTEEIYLELFSSQINEYKLLPLFNFLHEYMNPLRKKYNWGGDYLYMLSAMYKIHPSLVQHLSTDTRYSMSEVLSIFNFLKNIDSKNISVSQLDQIEIGSYKKQNEGTDCNEYQKLELPKFDEIILVGSGNSSIKYKDQLESFVMDKNCLLVTLNTLSPFTRDGLHIRAACNPVRFIADKEFYLNCEQKLLLPGQIIQTMAFDDLNISNNIITYNLNIEDSKLRYSPQSCTLSKPLSLFYSLCFLLSIQPDRIFLSGIDGYSKGDSRNDIIDNLFYQISLITNTKLISITPTIHKNITHNSIYNF